MESAQPPVAILLAVYAGDNIGHVSQALRSIADQTYPRSKMKLYVGIDGKIRAPLSNLLQRFSRSFPTVLFKSKHNIGLARTLNGLIDNLGDEQFVLRMDADDLCHPDRVASQIAFMQENPKVVLSGTDALEIDEHGTPTGRRKYPATHADIIRALPRFMPLLHPTFCFRASAFRDPSYRYRPELRYNQDLEMVFETARRGYALANLPKPLLSWRHNANFIARRTRARMWSEFRIYIRGTYALHGVTPLLVYPFARVAMRMLPTSWIKSIYSSRLRASFVNIDARG